MLSLGELKIYKELKQRESSSAIMYAGTLFPIVSDANEILSYIKKLFPEYPDHGLDHSFRILNYIASILTDKEIRDMTDTELFCLILSALFHDTGMALFESGEKDDTRENHHYKSELVINKYFEEKLQLLTNADRIKTAVLFACKSHNRLLDDLYKGKQFEITDNIAFDKVRYSLLAVLIRIGDLMDLENMRSNKFVLSLLENTFDKDALAHNLRHQNIVFYDYTPEKIDIEVIADNVTQHKIWLTWFNYLENDILRANTYLNNIHFPKLQYKITKSDGAMYNVQELRFEIDEKGGIWDIISQSIYTNKLDFLRELLQNAIDATLMKIYNNPSITLNSKSPRSWTIKRNGEDIVVGYSEKNNQLYVIDNGIGMSTMDLTNFLFKISGSGKADPDIRHFDFPGIAKFGIGFISCLVNAENIKIYTKKDTDKYLHYVTLESNSNLAFMEDEKCTDFVGTTIVLSLKNQFTFSDIKEYLNRTFKYSSVGITYINIDLIESFSKSQSMDENYYLLSKKPYLLKNVFTTTDEKRTEIITPIKKERSVLVTLCNKVENLLVWMQDNQEYDEKYPDKKKFKDFKNFVAEICHYIETENSNYKFPLKQENINEKSLLTEFEYTPKLNDYFETIQQAHKRLFSKLEKYPSFGDTIYNSSIYPYSDKKYMIVLLNESLGISRIIYTNDPIDLSSGTGVLLLNHQISDYDVGFEYDCINGFLFHDGELCNSIAKFSREEVIYKIGKHMEDCIVGTYCEPWEAWYAFDDDLEEEYYQNHYNLTDDDDAKNIYADTYDVIFIENNKLMLTEHSIDISGSLADEYNGEKCHYDFEDRIVSYYIKNNKTDENAFRFENLSRNLTSSYYQDGIKIPFNLEHLIPFGYFKITCNCTADSKMRLNVTRHNPSELHDDIEHWMNSTGSKIQKSILDNIENMLESLNLIFDFENLSNRNYNSDDYFARLCIDSL